MNSSAGKARRKWPCGGLACGQTARMVTGIALLLALCALSAPAAAARRPAAWSLGPWGGLFGQPAPKQRRAALQVAVPLPKPRPPEAPVKAPEQPEPAKQAPVESETQKQAEPAAPAPPPPSACRQALSEEIAIAPSVPDISGPGGCGGEDLVRLEAVVLPDKHRVAVKPAAILRCKMASAIADWIRTDMTPLAAGLGSEISDLDNFDSFECRGRNRVAGAQLSEHGRANALDVRGVKLANGQAISLTDRGVPRELRESVLHSVCTRFTTVLGPGSDGYHEDHIHLDLMERHNNYRICQWDVWDPLPRIAPLLPAARPEEAPPREVAAKTAAEPGDADKAGAPEPDVEKSASPRSEDAGSTTPIKPIKKRRQDRRF
ncbi:MAG: extensin family protein [Xanthobacteraceae bacterium]